jgi:osmotically-inducible protein OsmY
MRRWKRSGIAAAAAAILAAAALGGCSRDDQQRAQKAGREAGGQLRRAARQAVRETKQVIGKASAAAEDLALAGKVKSALLLNTHLDGAAIDVDTKNGVVTLSGTTLSRRQQAVALRVAREVRGVRRVTNALRVAPAPRRPALSTPFQT